MEVVLVNTGTDGAVAGRMLTPKDDPSALRAIALGHAIAALAGKAATLERPDNKLHEGACGDGDAPGGSSGAAGIEELLVLTHGGRLLRKWLLRARTVPHVGCLLRKWILSARTVPHAGRLLRYIFLIDHLLKGAYTP